LEVLSVFDRLQKIINFNTSKVRLEVKRPNKVEYKGQNFNTSKVRLEVAFEGVGDRPDLPFQYLKGAIGSCRWV